MFSRWQLNIISHPQEMAGSDAEQNGFEGRERGGGGGRKGEREKEKE